MCTTAVFALKLLYKMTSRREFGVSFSNISLCEIGNISVTINKCEISYTFKIENVSFHYYIWGQIIGYYLKNDPHTVVQIPGHFVVSSYDHDDAVWLLQTNENKFLEDFSECGNFSSVGFEFPK